MMGFGIVTDVHIIDVQTVIHLMIKRKQKWKTEEKDFLIQINENN